MYNEFNIGIGGKYMTKSDANYKQILIGVGRGILSLSGGGAFINEILSIKEKIYQDRINFFVETFLDVAEKDGIRIEFEQLNSEQFIDIMTSVFKRVVETRSQRKIEVFRDILLFNISTKYQSDFQETFLDLASRLDYIEIDILKLFKDTTGREGNLEHTSDNSIGSELLSAASYRQEIYDIIRSYFPELPQIDIINKYEFYMSDLTSKSLLMDKRTVGKTWADTTEDAFNVMYITAFGKEFLQFIRQ